MIKLEAKVKNYLDNLDNNDVVDYVTMMWVVSFIIMTSPVWIMPLLICKYFDKGQS